MSTLEDELDRVASDSGFSGVVRLDRDGTTEFERAYGWLHRGYRIPNTVDTRFALASGAKAFTALAVMSLVVDGVLSLSTPARSLLGDDLPLVDDAVTIEQLLGHRSGIGDYYDEDVESDITDYVLSVPVHRLLTAEDYLPELAGHPTKFAPGTAFSYCNGGYVLLALLAERATGMTLQDLVRERVCAPAGLTRHRLPAFRRTGSGIAMGYLSADGLRTNVLHLPVVGGGDGGIYSTAADMHTFWAAFFDGRIVPRETADLMTTPNGPFEADEFRYGLGFWLHPTNDDVAQLDGSDAGVLFRSVSNRSDGTTYSVLSNWSDGAWPMARVLRESVG